MGQYGRVALLARELYLQKVAETPREAWRQAAASIITSDTSRVKGCPRDAFLGLCSAGLVNGIPPGDYTRSEENKRYALTAVAKLQVTPSIATDKHSLWVAVAGESKGANSQMDVVIALWQSDMLADAPV
jgi:hypothetical protein